MMTELSLILKNKDLATWKIVQEGLKGRRK